MEKVEKAPNEIESEETEAIELVLFQVSECYVYMIPPRKSAASYRAIDMGMRPTSHFDKPGWMYVAQSFAEQTGVEFQREQFKNKWDSCKKNWRLWNKLIGETGVGWSNELKTIAASDEWWRARIQFPLKVSLVLIHQGKMQ
uniref:Myb/SANT-like domain-containing protein n=1 Tax=Salix viminalis TaxID=40686 RepID=A0A6N2N561_SALVM